LPGYASQPNGRPKKYKTAEELLSKINEYFSLCNSEQSMPSKAGLLYYLGFSHDSYWSQLRNKDEYKEVIEMTDKRMEAIWLDMAALNIVNPTIAKLNLSANYGYSEKTEQTVNTSITVNLDDEDDY
jgi:hypothetical protein